MCVYFSIRSTRKMCLYNSHWTSCLCFLHDLSSSIQKQIEALMLSPWVAMMNTSNIFSQFSNFQYYVLGYDNHPSTRTALSIKSKWYNPPSHHINLISGLMLGQTKRNALDTLFGLPAHKSRCSWLNLHI